ncbi:glycoside hydrolase family 32 protein [Pullulanibacillus pueri]|uniref:Glycoside hydrolase n=1 Tax=Pullulanibacillus pueri TaxID=1437324 RepID=A0A8J2ZZG9_9BACL|nr:glycoside hydrolase family 32 protein [Pullulanibacillus pueri]GGH86548.1 hypothetical protein GCM10007096_34510 [Pullulanibacillus pueri]
MRVIERPKLHFTARENWLNDPNGLVYYQGEYHLFFQHHPFGTTWGTMHWGHAVSQDLLHWEHLPIALFPDELGTIFSGSAVVDWQDTTGFFDGQPGLVAIFTHHLDTDTGVLERQSLAYSKDAGRTWTKYDGNPVLVNEQETDFRDPKVFWHDETQSWIMVVAAGQRVLIYTSSNLTDWSYRSAFASSNLGKWDGVWECPDLFELPVEDKDQVKKWVLLVSVGSVHIPGAPRTQYFVGYFDGTTFVNENKEETVLWLDYGGDNYAGVSWSDIPEEDGRRMYLGWMSSPKYANVTPTKEWRGALTLPRQLELRTTAEGIRLFQHPVEELVTVRQLVKTMEASIIQPDAPLISLVEHEAFEVIAEFEWKNAAGFGIQIKTADREHTSIGYRCDENWLYIDRSCSGKVDFHPEFSETQGVAIALREKRLSLRLIVDHCSVELFAEDGEVVMTSLIFPSQACKEIHWFADGGTVKLKHCEIYTLNS